MGDIVAEEFIHTEGSTSMSKMNGAAVAQGSIEQQQSQTGDMNLADAGFSPSLASGTGEVTIGGKKESFAYRLGRAVGGIAELTVEGVSTGSEYLTSVAVAALMLARKPITAAAGAVLALGSLPAASPGAIETSLTLDPQHRQLAADMGGNAVWFQVKNNSTGAIGFESGVAIDPLHILSSDHTTPSGTGSSYGVIAGTGSNYLTDPGSTAAILSSKRYPGYVVGDTNTIDLGLITLAEPLAARGFCLLGRGYPLESVWRGATL